MDVSVDLNRELNITGENEKGTQNENLIQTLKLKVPEEYADYNKKIVFIFEGEEIVWDLFDENDEYVLGKAVTQYESVDYYIWLTHGDYDFRSKTRTLYFNENKDASGEITPEEISGVNTVIALLEEEITKVDNINIVATKENKVTTITITDKEGESSSVEIEDGQDGQDGADALINGYNTVTMQGGTNISIEQEGNTLTINNTYEYDDTEVKEDIETIQGNISDINTTLEDKADKSEIPTKTSDLTNDSGFIDKNVNDLVNYTLKTNTGSLIDLEIDSTNYVVSLRLKNQDGTIISTDTIDLPLESVVVSGRYDNTTKKVILILENGSEVDFSVADLVAGLQTEITSSNKLASDLVDDSNSGNKFVTTSEKQTWNGKYDKPTGGIPSSDLADEVLEDYVKNTDYANASKGGTIKAGTTYNDYTIGNDGFLSAKTRTYAQYQADSDASFVGKGTLENVITGKQLINQTQLEESQAIQDEEIESISSEVEILQDLSKVLPTVSGEGEELTLNKTIEVQHISDKLGGNTSQETTEGNQLLNLTNGSVTNRGITGVITDNNILQYSGTATEGYANITNAISKEIPIGTYTFSIDTPTTNNERIVLYLIGDSNQSCVIQGENTSVTFTTTEIKTSYRVGITNTIVGNSYSGTVKMMWNEGSTVKDYEKYTGGIPSPNPSYPSDIAVVKGDNEIKVSNKNLFDKDNANILKTWFLPNRKTLPGRSGNDTIVYIPCVPNLTYTCSKILEPTANKNSCVVGTTSEVPDFGVAINQRAGGQGANITKASITTTSEDKYLMFFCHTLGGNVSLDDMLASVQIEVGSTATSYVPHQEQVLPINLGSIELAKIGTYQDYIYKENDKWYKYGAIGKKILDGTENWDSATSRRSTFSCRAFTDKLAGLNNFYCNKFRYLGDAQMQDIGYAMSFNANTQYKEYCYIQVPTDVVAISDKEAFKTWLSNNNVIVYYSLETPEITEITDTTLISQLEAWRNSKSYNGQSNISQTNDDKPFIITYETFKDYISDFEERISALENA